MPDPFHTKDLIPLKPLFSKPTVMVEYAFWSETIDGGDYWIQVLVDRQPYCNIGPFETTDERQVAYEAMMRMMKDTGAVDLSPRPN